MKHLRVTCPMSNLEEPGPGRSPSSLAFSCTTVGEKGAFQGLGEWNCQFRCAILFLVPNVAWLQVRIQLTEKESQHLHQFPWYWPGSFFKYCALDDT